MWKVVVAKISYQNLEKRDLPRFFQHWRILLRLKLAAFGGIFLIKKPTCCTYQNFCMTFTNVFGFLLNFSTSWKNCLKEQWHKKSCFQQFWLTVMICYLRPKREWNRFESLKSWQKTESATDKQSWECIQFLVNKSRA